MSKRKLVPPDGGWGWMILIAYAIFHFIYMPIIQNFGLIFKDTFKIIQLTATDTGIIINANNAVSMFMGLLNGPLLKRFNFRKVSIASALFVTLGLITTAFAKSFAGFVITYGFVTSVGLGLGMCSYPLALNSYFLKNRTKATGLALAITGLGSIVMPQVMTVLLNVYDIQGAVIILTGISLHMFVSALLLQPLKWHMVVEPDSLDACANSAGPECTIHGNNGIIAGSNTKQEEVSLEVNVIEKFEIEENVEKPQNFIMKTMGRIITAFDLTLLKDPQYVNILIGLAFALFGEVNFSMLTPFILSDIGMDTQEIATFLSVISTADLILRFIAPFIGDYFKLTAKTLFLLSLVVLSGSRFGLIYCTTFESLIGISVILGIAKGVRTVYWNLILPEYVPLDRLGNALSMEMIVNGIVVLSGGPLLGVIRDVTGSYANSIHVMNALTLATVFMWTAESAYYRKCKKKDIGDVK